VSWSQLLAVLAPPVCVACRAPLEQATAVACVACLRDVRWLGRRGCRRCGLPHHGGRSCPAVEGWPDTAWSPVAYQGAAQDLVRALKFHGALPAAALMAAQMAANAPPWALGAAEAVVPVPPARARKRRRGFDPADVLARELARRLGLPLARVLRRDGPATRQLGARREQRRAPGRITVRAVAEVPPSVLLVDDVHTTGATLAACARALRAGGARRVHAVTYARAL
jgi:ComF family protein